MTEAEQAAELGDILDTLVKWREIRREAQLRREAAGEPPPPLNYVDFTKPPAPIWFGRMKEAAKDGGAASLDASIRNAAGGRMPKGVWLRGDAMTGHPGVRRLCLPAWDCRSLLGRHRHGTRGLLVLLKTTL